MSDYIIMEKLNELEDKIDSIVDHLKINENDDLLDNDTDDQDMDTTDGEM